MMVDRTKSIIFSELSYQLSNRTSPIPLVTSQVSSQQNRECAGYILKATLIGTAEEQTSSEISMCYPFYVQFRVGSSRSVQSYLVKAGMKSLSRVEFAIGEASNIVNKELAAPTWAGDKITKSAFGLMATLEGSPAVSLNGTLDTQEMKKIVVSTG